MVSPPGVDTHRHHPPLPALRSLLAALVALVALVGAVSVLAVAVPAASADNWAPVHPGDFPDPSILNWGGQYYGFATQNFAVPSQTLNIQVSTSLNGTTWTQLNGVDALPHLPSWAKEGETWAPTVFLNSTAKTFVMY